MSKRAKELAAEVPMIWPGTLAETIADWRQHITALIDAELRKGGQKMNEIQTEREKVLLGFIDAEFRLRMEQYNELSREADGASIGEQEDALAQLHNRIREALALLPPEEETRQSSESPHDWIERMWHIRNSDQWGEEIKAQSERWVQDSSDRKLLLVDSWNEGDLYEPMKKASNIAYGEYVALDDFQALAERFVLAWELITTSEQEAEPAPSSEKAQDK